MTTATLPEIIQDDRKCVESFFFIPSKQGGETLRMKLKPAQVRTVEAMQRYKKIIVLKSSQVGSTSGITAVFFRRTMYVPNTTSVIMSHKGELSKHLFDRTTFFYDHLLPSLQVPMDGDSKIEKSFPAVGSKIYIGTAGSSNFGRGEPVHNFLGSEWLFYTEEQYKTVVIPLLKRVPEMGTAVLESTPNGENFGYELIQDVIEGHNRVWHLIVFYWFEEPDNQLRPSSPLLVDFPELHEEELEWTSEEEELNSLVQESHGFDLTHDQIRWRRYQIEEDEELFFQEQVESLSTCFLRISSPYYDVESCKVARKHEARPEMIDGVMVWEKPIPGVEYFIGGDAGLARRSESSAWVIRIEDGEPRGVALLASKMMPKEFGVKVVKLARWYNNAFVTPEYNNHGIAFIDSMKEQNYPRIYMRRDIIKGVPIWEYGWLTTGNTKDFMMEEINRQLPFSVIPDRDTQAQIRAFGTDEKGRIVTTMLDDRHDAWGLSLMGARSFLKAGRGKAKGSSGFTSWDR